MSLSPSLHSCCVRCLPTLLTFAGRLLEQLRLQRRRICGLSSAATAIAVSDRVPVGSSLRWRTLLSFVMRTTHLFLPSDFFSGAFAAAASWPSVGLCWSDCCSCLLQPVLVRFGHVACDCRWFRSRASRGDQACCGAGGWSAERGRRSDAATEGTTGVEACLCLCRAAFHCFLSSDPLRASLLVGGTCRGTDRRQRCRGGRTAALLQRKQQRH
jgi:hypothetical protein